MQRRHHRRHHRSQCRRIPLAPGSSSVPARLPCLALAAVVTRAPNGRGLAVAAVNRSGPPNEPGVKASWAQQRRQRNESASRARYGGRETCDVRGSVLQPSQRLTLIVCGCAMFNSGDPGRSQVCNREVPGRVDIQQGSRLRWLQRGVRIWTGAHTQCSAVLQDDFKHLCKHFTEKILRKERHTLSFTSSVQTKLKKYLARFFNNMPEPVYERGFEGLSGPPPTVQ